MAGKLGGLVSEQSGMREGINPQDQYPLLSCFYLLSQLKIPPERAIYPSFSSALCN